MFYYVFILLIAILFLLITGSKSNYAVFLILLMLSFTVAVFALMFLLSKDNYYFYTVYRYFSLPSSIWRRMMLFHIDKGVLVTIMNGACLLTLYFALSFALSFLTPEQRQLPDKIRLAMIPLFLLEFILYQPSCNALIYLALYPRLLSLSQISMLKHLLEAITQTLHFSVIIFSVYLLLSAYRTTSPLRLIRRSIFFVLICFTMIMISYQFIFLEIPCNMVKVSSVAGIITYRSVPLIQSSLITSIFPYYLVVNLLLICYCIYRISYISAEISQNTFTLSKQIDASETTSKTFCHYMKNELLAIKAEAELLDVSPQSQVCLNNVVLRCDRLYERLDSIHRSTKASELCLTETNLADTIREQLQCMEYELRNTQVNFAPKYPLLTAMIDAGYFRDALHNILSNSLEAMEDLPDRPSEITISVTPINNWIMILIRDNGPGMSPDSLNNLFKPFYTSKPVTKHWGMGMSLTYKIITAHEGQIEAESTPGQGTAIKILLPRL